MLTFVTEKRKNLCLLDMTEFVKNYTGGLVAAQVFDSREALEAENRAVDLYRGQFNEIRAAVAAVLPGARFSFTEFVPYLQHVRLSAIRPEDEPAIAENGVYVDFRVNMKERKIEISQTGHIWLTAADQKASYLCMCGVKQCVEATGGKWLRKSGYKSPEDLAGKLSKFWAGVLESLEKGTEGYPYKNMAINIYAK